MPRDGRDGREDVMYPPARANELWIGIGNHEFLRKNCVEPAFVSLKSALDALKVIWENRPGGRPALQLIIRLLRLCVCVSAIRTFRAVVPPRDNYNTHSRSAETTQRLLF